MSVEWVESAKDQWADIWTRPATVDERELLARTYHEIDDRLERGPQFLGESRGGNERVWFCPPLVVRFVLIPYGPVKVVHVARLGKRPADDDDS